VLWQDSAFELNASKKLHLFLMTVQEGLAAEEEEESKLIFLLILKEKLK
jgi:hypothetical protein